MMHSVSRVGFTLIEILIVIAIIGLLAAALIPNLLAARQRAHDVGAQSCAKELLTQAEIYIIASSTHTGFDGTGAYEPRSCTGGRVASFGVLIATAADVSGTVTSLSGTVFSFSNTLGIVRQ